jgi:NAD(P)-dependent dehydrogenase (short-subunit alcohol dehydrogenase family)
MAKIAVVTGGSAGVGRATVRELTARGYDVAILARGWPGLDGALADVKAAGQRGLCLSVDVADGQAVDEAAEQVERELGPIDVWVNNAFVGFLAPFEQVSLDEFHRVTDVTYHGQVHGTMAALKRMRPRDRGVIIQVGSALAFRGIPLQSAYCGAKHAIVGFTESVITELGHDRSHVKVCMVHLPALNTPQFSWVLNKMPKHPMPVPPIYQPEVAGRAIAYLADHPRRTMWVGETTCLTILGNKVAPWLLDKYLARTGYEAQQDEKRSVESMDPPNLFDPVPVDHGAHGVFDNQSHEHSPQTWATMHRGAVAVTSAAALLLGFSRMKGTFTRLFRG